MSEIYLVQQTKRERRTRNAYLKILPPYVRDFFRKHSSYSMTTQRVYATAIKKYLIYVADKKAISKDILLKDLPLAVFLDDRERYLASYPDYLKATGASPSTIVTSMQAIRAFYRYLASNGTIADIPVTAKKPIKVERKPPYALSPHQIHLLLQGMRENRYYLADLPGIGKRVVPITPEVRLKRERLISRNVAIILVLLGTGIKESELIGLDLEDLFLEEQYFTVYRSLGKKEHVYFGPDVAEVLADYLNGGGIPTDLFTAFENKEELITFARIHMTHPNIKELAKKRFETEDADFLRDMERCASCLRHEGRQGLKPKTGVTALFLSMRGTRMQRRMIDTMIKEMAATYLAGSISAASFSSQNLRYTYLQWMMEKTGNAGVISAQMGQKALPPSEAVRLQYQIEANSPMPSMLITKWN